MKGKGKGDRAVDRTVDRIDKNDVKECPLTFPDLKPVEHAKMCPRYTAVYNRNPEESVGIEELDTLQTELETLLASVAKRMRLLEGEISTLTNWQDKKDKKGGSCGKGQPEPPVPVTPSGKQGGKQGGKRGGKGGEDKPSKKFKDNSTRAVPVSATPSKNKGKSQPTVKEFEFPDSPKPPPPELPKIPKNETPNRFWAMVEPYCQEITNEDLKVLEDILRTHEDEAEYYKIPSLGKHFSQRWAQEDLLDEQREGNKIGDRRKSNSNGTNSDPTNLLKRLEDNDDEPSPFGPLTQRLVQALIEENIMTPLDDTAISEADAVEAATISPRSLAKQLNLGNAATLERRIKRELEEQGILEVDEKPEDNPDDEILIELRKKQQELKSISAHNMLTTKRLYKIAKEEMQRQDIRKKMIAADAEVMEAYRKIQAARAKKKTPTKKELDMAKKALKEREGVIKTLEGMGS